MSSKEARAAIPRPSQCRMVLVSTLGGEPIPSMFGSHPSLPAMVIAIVDEKSLSIECEIFGTEADRYGRSVPHADLAPEGADPRSLVWRWPGRVG